MKKLTVWLTLVCLIFMLICEPFIIFAEEKDDPEGPEYGGQHSVLEGLEGIISSDNIMDDERLGVPATEKNSAMIDFSNFDMRNVASYAYFDGQYSSVKKKGRQGIRFSEATQGLYLAIDIKDDFLYEPKGTEVRVDVDYFDEGYGKFSLNFSSADINHDFNTDIVQLNNTMEWKTHHFYIKNFAARNTCFNAYDIVLSEWTLNMLRSPEDVSFGNIVVVKLPQPMLNPIVDTPYVGNILSRQEECSLQLNLHNNYDVPAQATVETEVYDFWGKLVDTQSLTCSVDAKGGVLDIKPNISKMGLYTLKTTIKATDENGKTYTGTTDDQFSITDKFLPGEEKIRDYGISTHWWHYSNEEKDKEFLEVLDSTGVGMIRDNMLWASVETTKKDFKMYNDALVYHDVVELGVDPLIVAGPANPIYYDYGPYAFRGPQLGDEEAIQGYVDYAVWLVTEHKDLKYIEIWNEWNNTGRPASEYIETLLKPAYTAIKKVRPDITVIGGSSSMSSVAWNIDAFKAGAGDYCDVWSLHPYDFDGCFRKYKYYDDMKAIRNAMAEAGHGDMEVWLTEFGWATSTQKRGVSLEHCAAYAIEAYAMAKGDGLAERIWWYDLMNDAALGNNNENMFGIVQYFGDVDPWVAKPTYVAITSMLRLLGHVEAIDNLKLEDETYIYRFKNENDNKQIAVAWSDGKNKSLKVDLGTPTVELMDMYGNVIETYNSADGKYNFGVSDMPIYIRGNMTKLEAVDDTNISVNANYFEAAINEEVTFEVTDKLGRELKLDVDTELEIVKNEGGTLVVKAPNEVSKTKFNVIVNADNVPVYHCVNALNATTPLAFSTKLERVTDNYSRAVVTVTNFSQYSAISGDVNITAPDDIASKTTNARFFNMKPRETQSFVITLPQMVKKRPQSIETTVTLDTGYAESKTQLQTNTYITKTEKAPVIDGKIDKGEWNSTWYVADRFEDIWKIPNWAGKSDISFRGNMMWDDEYLYMVFDVYDDVFYQPFSGTNSWQADGVQIGFSRTTDSDYQEISIYKSDAGVELYRFNNSFGTIAGFIEGREVEIVRNAANTVYEIKLPWTDIYGPDYKPELGQQLLYTVLVNDNDNDNAGRGWIEFCSGMGSGKDITKYGLTSLTE